MLIPDFIFVTWQDPNHQPRPYLLLFNPSCEAKAGESRFICTSVSKCLRTRAFGRCPVPAPCAGIKLTYCTSVMQREQSYSRQLLFEDRDFRARPQRSACLHVGSARCQSQSAPFMGQRYVNIRRKAPACLPFFHKMWEKVCIFALIIA